jgi:hypothetical protein
MITLLHILGAILAWAPLLAVVLGGTTYEKHGHAGAAIGLAVALFGAFLTYLR